MKNSFQTVFVTALVVSAFLLTGMLGCGDSGEQTKAKSTGDSSILADAITNAALVADCDTKPLDPCNPQRTPKCCRAIADCDALTPQCIQALMTQHWIDTSPSNSGMLRSFRDRTDPIGFTFSRGQIKDSIAGLKCNYQFVMRMFDSTNGYRYCMLGYITSPGFKEISRVFPLSLVSYILKQGPDSATQFEFYQLRDDTTCPVTFGTASILMKVKRGTRFDQYDVSVPPDFTRDSSKIGKDDHISLDDVHWFLRDSINLRSTGSSIDVP